MIIVMGEFNVAPEDTDQYISCRAGRIRASRAEQGCQEYSYSVDPLTPGRVVLTERWRSEEDFAAHVERVRAAGLELPGDVPVLSGDIRRYVVASEQIVASAELPK